MKTNFTKLLLLSIISTSIFTSCKNDDNGDLTSNNEKKVIKKIKSTGYEFINGTETQDVSEGTFIYDKDYKKLLNVNYTNGMISTYKYDTNDNLITVEYNGATNPLENSTLNLFYNGNKLAYTQTVESGTITQRNEYYYNNLGKFNKEIVCSNGSACNGDQNAIYSYTNNNITSVIDKTFGSWFSDGMKNLYEFDKSNSPYKNSQEVIRILQNQFMHSYSENNVVKETQYWSLSNAEPNRIVTYTYTYDKDNFPILIVGKDEKGNNYFKVEYEYYN
ncbi:MULTISPECIES: hypothetical protein [Empedobacter]|uniref:DUF4595 domain-containing protein n=1 Tax=Empedobacter falsenii TaxID=343874 RepID=A0A7H9DSV4_9FLAO|nr:MULTISPECIES: hypothetical protein [Empedobacter]QLL58125.1 hypothetical protein FH779_08545 [Empedobacter falsenii]